MLLFDGLDELTEKHKEVIRNRIRALATTYPGNTIIVTSRIVGYENPFRFDDSEYRHHRVAPLELPEMKRFVQDWYRARVEAKALRESHVADLIRILEDGSQESIRELARNPLLLTIIALVHRVDAVLPDERVVLYQKCTETLLNTWHHWKYKDQEVPKKGKIERRNRTRMQAIAHWMQCRGTQSDDQRAIAPHEELSEFLAGHILENEKARVPDDEPEDLAEEFLEFVKQRAGLLIEVGDRRYSFVHLTFQEYLTAAYFKTRTQGKGIAEIWRQLGSRSSEPRWHEVIRLFTAALDSDDAQEHVVANLLEAKKDANCAKLLGGFLLDGISPAEERELDIVSRLFHVAAAAGSASRLQLVLEPLRSWVSKEGANQDKVAEWLSSRLVRRRTSVGRERLFLVALAAQVSESALVEASTKGFQDPTPAFRLFWKLPESESGTEALEEWSSRHLSTQRLWSLSNPASNFVAAMTQFVWPLPSHEAQARTAFTVGLTTLPFMKGGPCRHQVTNIALFSTGTPESIRRWARDREPPRGLARGRGPVKALVGVLARGKVLDQALDRALDRPLNRARGLARARARGLARALERALERDRPLARTQALSWAWALALEGGMPFWHAALAEPQLVNILCEYLDLVFQLKPRPQWDEALKTRFFPRIAELVRAFDENLWGDLRPRFDSGKTREADCLFACCQLLTDSALYIFGHHNKPEKSRFAGIAELTRNIDHPALRVAHCLRDLSYGDESRSDDLIAMVRSKDPAYRRLFEDALWIDPPK